MKKAEIELYAMLADLEEVVENDDRFENPKAIVKNLAAIMGVSTWTISAWFHGRHMPNGYRHNNSHQANNYRKLKRRIYYYTRTYGYYQKNAAAENAGEKLSAARIVRDAGMSENSISSISQRQVTQSGLMGC